MSRAGLTPHQHRLLVWIKAFQEEKGYSPSYQEMADAMGYVNRSAAHRLVHQLRDRGYITLREHLSRSISINVDVDDHPDGVHSLKLIIRNLRNKVNRLEAELSAKR